MPASQAIPSLSREESREIKKQALLESARRPPSKRTAVIHVDSTIVG